jgi:DNA-binding MarR family transcriptional regulator
MGRGVVTAPPIPIETIQATFALRPDGEIVRRGCHIAALSGEPATFVGPTNKLMVRLGHQGKIRRVLASKVAFALAVGQWPSGPVRQKNGDPGDLRPGNLVVTKYAAHQPQASGGKASSLERRQATNAAILNALAERAVPTLAELSRAVGLSEGRISARLGKLAEQGLTISPQCVPKRHWALTDAGRAAAQASIPVVDNLDRSILAALVFAPMRKCGHGAA